jgi:hypothetical protein
LLTFELVKLLGRPKIKFFPGTTRMKREFGQVGYILPQAFEVAKDLTTPEDAL